ncbi:hypothetical protein D9758_016229 [Tetrapyrgos nigripes]|uniref:Cytochrome P450 n=1 Tax=Tetrapyrgos nigripes TaxID=182062 RepID=A0A8H5C6Z2_9AGAR|nr:hypothetical protein D9758_016229 [Tetrapyrgos nigripes]
MVFFAGIPHVVAFSLLVAVLFRLFLTRRRNPLPPGPKGLTSLIDTLAIRLGVKKPSSQHLYLDYIDLAKRYNTDVLHIEVLGDHTIVLNSMKAVMEIFDKRSALYSDRPHLPMINDLMGWFWDFGHYYPIQRLATNKLMKRLLDSPEDFNTHFQRHSGNIILRVTYGMTSEEDQDFYVKLVHRAIEPFHAAFNHGTYLVDYFPPLKHIPAWFPGAGFKRNAKIWSQYAFDLRDKPWEKMKASIKAGTVPPCFVTENLERFGSESEMEEVVKNTSAVAYLGGSDSSVTLMLSIILNLLLHPEIQEKAQAELDSVLGQDGSQARRLPDYSDRPFLSYIDAIIDEVMRLQPITPLAAPHRVMEHDIYEGYWIPKGSTVIGNAWAILHDPEVYPEPFKFDPDRFIKKEGQELPPNPSLFGFGFGRRICPGRWLALDTTWLVIASLLATCNFKKALDVNGKEIEPVVEYEYALISHPKPFKCRFVPRSPEAVKLMQNGFDEKDVTDT